MQSQRPTDPELASLARQYGAVLHETRSYVLPSGEKRQLAVFGIA
jgi:hypothetical protein